MALIGWVLAMPAGSPGMAPAWERVGGGGDCEGESAEGVADEVDFGVAIVYLRSAVGDGVGDLASEVTFVVLLFEVGEVVLREVDSTVTTVELGTIAAISILKADALAAENASNASSRGLSWCTHEVVAGG